MLKGKKILLAITGSIAAYKSVILLRELTKAGAEVKVILTPSARDFVTPLTLSTLSGHPILDELFNEGSWNNHVMLGRWADVMIIAPLSCNTLAKIANGLCDNLLMATYLSSTCPVIVAPAMDEDMWMHPATKNNIEKIISYGNIVLPVGNGALASGLSGHGRMAEPESILHYLTEYFFKQPLKGKKVLVTAGPTYEALDPVRFIGNHSSGKMGIVLAEELNDLGAEVSLVLGPTNEKVADSIMPIRVTSAKEMLAACTPLFDQMDIIIMAAAVADFTPSEISIQKIKKGEGDFDLKLRKTTDILKAAGDSKKKGQILVGFALETNNEKENALKKLHEKKLDLVVLNSLNDYGAGFKKDTNKITIFRKDGSETNFDVKDKRLVAKDIINTILKIKNE